MMKKIAALLLALSCCLSTAFAWSCPGCGGENSGKFCTECGTKKPANICPSCGKDFGDKAPKFCTECGTKLGTSTPAATPTAAPTATPIPQEEGPAITYAGLTDLGNLGVMWRPEGGEPCTAAYVLRQSDDPWADAAANASFNTIYDESSDGVSGTQRVIPGADYWVGLFDAQGRGGYVPVEGNDPGIFDDCTVKLQVQPRRKVNGKTQSAKTLDVKDIEKGTPCGLSILLDYNKPGAAKGYTVRMVVEAPNGSRWPEAADIAFTKNGRGTAGWGFYDLTEYFQRLQEGFGTIPAGEYKLSLYLDMDLVGVSAFTVEGVSTPAATATSKPTQAPTARPTATPAPAVSARADIQSIVSNGDGTVTLSWSGGTAPYKVYYAPKKSSDVLADRTAATAQGSYWIFAQGLQEQSITINRLEPGVEYWLFVLDANEKGQARPFTPAGGVFTDFPVTLEMHPRQQIAGTTTDIPCIPADTAGLDDGTKHGAYMYMTYNNPGAPRTMLMQIALTCPDGFRYVYTVGEVEFDSGLKARTWNFYNFDELLVHLRSYQSKLSEGDMTISIYLDGKLAGSGTLPVKTLVPLEIIGAVNQGNNKHLLTWKDNGCGPYTVYYHQRFTDNAEADSRDKRGSGRWIDQQDLTQPSLLMMQLVPGKSYWLTVADSNGTLSTIAYDVPAAANLTPAMTLEGSPRQSVNDAYTDMAAFSAAALNEDYSGSYGLKMALYYDAPAQDTALPSQWVLTLPNGVSICDGRFDLNVFAAGSSHWDIYTLDWDFSQIKRLYGEVLTGEYRLDVYVEGKHAAGATFLVTEDGSDPNSEDALYGVDITSITENGNGTATVTWTDANNNGPYKVYYTQKLSEDYQADRTTGPGTLADTSTAPLGSYVMEWLTPGQAYWIGVYDADGYGTYTSYTPAAAKPFPEFTFKLSCQPVLRTSKDKKISQFSSAEISSDAAKHGLFLKINYPQLAKARKYKGVVSITAPDGSRVVNNVFDMSLSRGKASSLSWDFFNLDWYFGILVDEMGACPVGTYTVELFCDGEYAASTTFNIAK